MTIAEALAYNRAYSPKLNPKIWDDDKQLLPEVKEKVLEIVDKFLEYANVDIKVADIKLVGSNASFNYNDDSDLDVHIVTDLSKIADPESIARLYMDSIKKTFKESYDITIRGIDVEMYVEDIKTSAQSNGVYSVLKDEWTKVPKPMRDPTPEEFAEAEEIEEELISRLENTDDPLEISDILDEIYLGRKDALAKDGETAPFNLAFKSLRNKGILKQANDFIKEKESEELSLESKNINEDVEYKGFTIEEQPWTFKIGDQTHKTINIFVRKGNFLYTPVEDKYGDGDEWVERPCKTVEDAKSFIDNMDHTYYKKTQIS